MPWNCLCSSDKERHKLEISAPILNRDGSAKIIQNPANDANSNKINSTYQRNANREAIVSTNNSHHDGNKLHTKTASKQRQRSKKNGRNSKNLHAKFQSGEQQSPFNPSDTLNFMNNTIDPNGNAPLSLNHHQRHEPPQEDDTTYSQLIFERQVNKPNEPSSANVLSTNNKLKTPATQHQDLNIGHYDRLPFDKSSSKVGLSFQRTNGESINIDGHQWQAPQNHVHDQPGYQSKQSRTTSTTGVSVSNGEVIPFIDEEDVVSIVEKHGTHLQINEGNENDYATTRIITLHPKNIGSSQTIQRGKMLQRTQLANMSLRKPRGGGEIVVIDSNANVEVVSHSESVSRVPNQIQLGRVALGGGVHDFCAWNAAKGKLCQVCHASVLNESNSVVKCRCCDLVCHLWCAPKITVSGFCIRFMLVESRDSKQ